MTTTQDKKKKGLPKRAFKSGTMLHPDRNPRTKARRPEGVQVHVCGRPVLMQDVQAIVQNASKGY